MATTNAIVTTLARSKMVKARAGEITLPVITGMAFGDGGVDSGGQVIPPTSTQTALNHELLRKAYTAKQTVSSTTIQYDCTLSESELAGEKISEIALYDDDGDLLCIKTFSAKGKDADLELTFSIQDIF